MNTQRQESHALGARGEQLVCDHILKQGFTILMRNMRIQGGEIDLIAKKNDLIICVEVKTRTDPTNDMAELISPWQQRRIINAAKQFLTSHKLEQVTCRFDVALVAVNQPSMLGSNLEYIPNAFEECF